MLLPWQRGPSLTSAAGDKALTVVVAMGVFEVLWYEF